MFFGHTWDKKAERRDERADPQPNATGEPDDPAAEQGEEMSGCGGYVPEAMRTEALEQRFQFAADPLGTWRGP